MNSGIYIIKNKINGKVYVGSAVSMQKRRNSHFYCLKNNKHHSNKLQNSFNKYGIDSFEHIIIQYCNKEELVLSEQYWIDYFDSYNNGYNCVPKAGSTIGREPWNKGRKMTKEFREKLSNSKKGLPAWNKGKKGIAPANKGVRTFCIKEMYELLNSGLKQKDVAKKLNISQSHISKIINNKN